MSRYTYVVEYPDGQEPVVNAGTQLAGGRLVAVNFSDALAEPVARPLDKWDEEFGPVVWWALDLEYGGWLGEPAWIGTPNDSDWPGYHTHWTPHPAFPDDPPPATSATEE
ncbi:hypothetical protein [Martelella alba]|uniref:hypothetical protein n=1 Tax=Martelella alba TaxID=2590451 RepID=UPI001E3FD994|nr:hypothetical protein [Martelella alba]